MGNILPGIIGNVGCHQDGVIKTLLPDILPAVDDPSIVFQHPLPSQLYLWVNFRHSSDCERLSDLHIRERKES